MERVPVWEGGRQTGELTVERQGLYLEFEVRSALPDGQLWRAWAIGELGAVYLGVLEPQGDTGRLHRRISCREAAGTGRLLRGELLLRKTAGWQAAARPEILARTPWLRKKLRGKPAGWARRTGECLEIALPLDPGQPFPLPELFCLARTERIGDGLWAVFRFDRREQPQLPL